MKIRSIVVLLTLIFAALTLAQTAASQSAAGNSSRKTEAPKQSATVPSPVDDGEYKIGPQDVLRIDVWKEPDISRTIPVRPDGKISLPFLNDIQAAGLTAMQLTDAIRTGLTKFIVNPQVTVAVSEINSRRVYVTGEVLHAGALTLLPNMTVLQALSSAGGFTQFAKLKGIYVLRTEDGKQVQHAFNYKDAVKGVHPEQNILLQPGDVIVVP